LTFFFSLTIYINFFFFFFFSSRRRHTRCLSDWSSDVCSSDLSIVITSSLPGEGKTLTTMNVGLCYAQLPQQRVLVIDGDMRTRGLTAMLDHPNSPGLAEILSGDVGPDEAIVATNQKNLFILPAGTISSPSPELFTGTRWQ